MRAAAPDSAKLKSREISIVFRPERWHFFASFPRRRFRQNRLSGQLSLIGLISVGGFRATIIRRLCDLAI